MMDKTVVPRHTGHDYGAPNLDAVGVAYIVVCVIWTLFIGVGLTYFLLHRQLDFVRMRNATVTVCAVLMLHVYLSMVLLLYPANGNWPCDLEFWLMSLYFPLGIALFQAQNTQLLSISCLQKELMFRPLVRHRRRHLRLTSCLSIRSSLAQMSLVRKTFIGIGVGAVLQFLMSMTIFLISRKFNSFGIVSTSGDAAQCRTGWEWFPSILWQLSWTYIAGPYVLFRIRKIHDTHRWALQTTLAICASLPGPLLWMLALYSSVFKGANKYWPAAMWFAPGLMMAEFVLIFFPLLEVYTSSKDRQTTASAIAEWERKRQNIESLHSGSMTQPSVSDTPSSRSRKSDMYSMQALERALESNHGQLLEYAATREFTGENIIFLTRVRDFKEQWTHSSKDKSSLDLTAQRQLFDTAANIFTENVCLHTAQFPINIESKIYFDLDAMFGKGLSRPGTMMSSDDVTPFADRGGNPAKATTGTSLIYFEASLSTPEDFDDHVFDRAENSVKYMVLTNTWAKYIDQQRLSRRGSMSTHGGQGDV